MWKLVETISAEDPPYASNSGIGAQFMVALVLAAEFILSLQQIRQTAIGVLVHRPKLQTPKTPAALTDTDAPVDNWSGRLQSYAGADDHREGKNGQAQQKCHEEVEAAL